MSQFSHLRTHFPLAGKHASTFYYLNLSKNIHQKFILLRLTSQFRQFSVSLTVPSVFLPISPSLMALFMAYKFNFRYASATDPFKLFYVYQIIKGYKKVGFHLDSRLPITLPILNQLVSITPFLQGSTYQISQFQAMCSLVCYAFLHLGEKTTKFNNTANPPLQLYQIT